MTCHARLSRSVWTHYSLAVVFGRLGVYRVHMGACGCETGTGKAFAASVATGPMLPQYEPSVVPHFPVGYGPG